MGHYYGYHYSFLGPGFGLWGFILSVIFWVIAISIIASLLRHRDLTDADNQVQKTVVQNNNIEIIKRRYAEGAINKKEYEQLKHDLS